MKKGQGRLGLLLIVVVALIAGGLIFGMTQQGFFGGSTTLSIDDVNIQGDDVIVLTAALGTGYDRYIIDFTASDLEDRLNGVNIEENINGEIKITDFRSEFDLQKSTLQNDIWWTQNSVRFFNNILAPGVGNWDTQTGINECEERGAVNVVNWFAELNGPPLTADLYCLEIEPNSARGDLLGGVQKKFTITVEIEGETVTMDQDDSIVSLHGGDVKVQLLGGGLAAFNDLEEVPYDVLWQPSSFQHLISESAVSIIGRTAIENYFQSFPGSNQHMVSNPNSNSFTGRATQWVNLLSNTLDSKNSEFELNPVVTDVQIQTNQGGSFTTAANGDLIVHTVPTGFPVVRITLDADFVGIAQTGGKPDIVSCVSDIEIDSGENVQGNLVVKNTGSGTGDFNAKAVCDSGIDAQIADIGLVDAGETKSVSTLIGGLAQNDDVSGECTITVTDFNTGNKDSCGFDVEVLKVETLCAPQAIQCNSEGNIVQCADNGNSFEEVEQCASQEFCGFNFNSGFYECMEEDNIDIDLPGFGDGFGGGDGDGFFDKLSTAVSDAVGSAVFAIIIGIAIIILLVIIYLVVRAAFFRRRVRRVRRNR